MNELTIISPIAAPMSQADAEEMAQRFCQHSRH
jgi:hypothetical protein